jgi:hypothetical protein
MTLRSIAVAGALLCATVAHAAEVFSDDFNASVSGLNVTPTGWTVTDGTVDVVGASFCQSGLCVDLDGSTVDAGVLSREFSLEGGVQYTVTFDLSGNKRGGLDDVVVMFGSASRIFDDLAAATPYATYSLDFTPGSDGTYTLSFANAGGDNVGALLDNVRINAAVAPIPEPETYALMLLGLGAMGAAVRRRRQTKA